MHREWREGKPEQQARASPRSGQGASRGGGPTIQTEQRAPRKRGYCEQKKTGISTNETKRTDRDRKLNRRYRLQEVKKGRLDKTNKGDTKSENC